MIPLDDPLAAELYERVFCARSEGERDLLRRQITMRPAGEHAEWETLLADMDLLYRRLEDVSDPPMLSTKLLEIAKGASSRTFWQRAANYQIGWKELAAILVLAASLATYFYWPKTPVVPKLLNDSLARQIADAAIRSHQSAPLELTSSDTAQVLARLQQHGYTFPAQVLHSNLNTLTLLGEGSATFNGQPVAFTRWKQNESIYTLLQFDGKDFDLPAAYLQTVTTPHPAGPRVDIWQGAGGCAWALVADASLPKNPFTGYY